MIDARTLMTPVRPHDVARDVILGSVPYVADLTLPGIVHASFVHAPAVDVTVTGLQLDADDRENILDLIDAERIRLLVDQQTLAVPVFASERVRYAGEPVGMVIARSREIARRIALAVRVNTTPHVSDGSDSNGNGEQEAVATAQLKTAETVAAASGATYRGHYKSDRMSHVPMENHAAIANWDADGSLTVWTASQYPWRTKSKLAKLFDIAEDKVRIIVPRVGGGFGCKGDTIEYAAAAAALVVRRPVKLELDRAESFLVVAKHPMEISIETEVGADGTLSRRSMDIDLDAGAYGAAAFVYQAAVRAAGPYHISDTHIVARSRQSDNVTSGPLRGTLTPDLCLAYESEIERIAHGQGIDVIEFRRRNIIRPGGRYATGEVVEENHIDALLTDLDEAFASCQCASRLRPTEAYGVGFGLMVKNTAAPAESWVKLRLYADGMARVYASGVEIGQGMQETLADITSHELGVSKDRIEIHVVDTHHTPYDYMTGSSRSTASFAPAIAEAAGILRDKIGKRIRTDDDCATSSFGAKGYLEASGCYRSRAGGVSSLDRETGQGHASEHWHQAGAAAEVAVDTETFQVRVLHLHGAVYAGRSVSRERIHQQNRGGLVMGLGMAMFESLDIENGEILNANLSEYVIPSMEDQPRLSSSIVEALEPDAEPYGVGEMVIPAVPAALFNAVADATGCRMHSMPLRAESIWKASHQNDDK